MPTHGHGQGYTDLNFLIPELVDYVDYKLGVYHAEVGDFGSAGGAEFHLRTALPHPFVRGGGGIASRRTRRRTRSSCKAVDLLVGGEAKHYDGPWQVAEAFGKRAARSLLARRGTSHISLLALAYHNSGIPPTRFRAGGRGRPHFTLWPARFDRRRENPALQRVGRTGITSARRRRSASSCSPSTPISRCSRTSRTSSTIRTKGDQFNRESDRTILGGNASHRQQVAALGAAHTLTRRRRDTRGSRSMA